MAASSASIGKKFWRPARRPVRIASPNEDWGRGLGLKGLPAAARLLGVRVRDPEARAGQPILVIDDGASQVNQAAFLDKKLHAVGREFLVTRFAGRNFHRIGHARASAGLDVNAEAFAFGVGLADDLGDVPGSAFGQADGGQGGNGHKRNLKEAGQPVNERPESATRQPHGRTVRQAFADGGYASRRDA